MILESSGQSIYIYLDDNHIIYNQKFASLLGYSSPKELAKVEDPFMSLVAEKSQETLSTAYQKAVEKMEGSSIGITWKNKMGGEVNTKVILVPIIYAGKLFAIHFIS